MTGLFVVAVYIGIFVASFFLITKVIARATTSDFTSLKTVTFGDESAVRPNRWAGIISILTLFLIWGMFTGSSLLPGFLHAPAPFAGTAEFTYTVDANGQRDDATVTVIVHPREEKTDAPEVEPGDGFAKNDSAAIAQWRSGLIRVDKNDEIKKKDGSEVVAINGQPIARGETVTIDTGTVTLSDKGTPNFVPDPGWQMEPLYLPAPETVLERTGKVISEGFRSFTLAEHLGWSLFRVIAGFVLGALVGIPLGYAMGLSNWFRGWFDPIVEFMRPVPPLALIPLVIIWFGIGEGSKVATILFGTFFPTVIATYGGIDSVDRALIRMGQSFGLSRFDIIRKIVLPAALPAILSGMRISASISIILLVAAEMFGAEYGIGAYVLLAGNLMSTDQLIAGVAMLSILGLTVNFLIGRAERHFLSWRN